MNADIVVNIMNGILMKKKFSFIFMKVIGICGSTEPMTIKSPKNVKLCISKLIKNMLIKKNIINLFIGKEVTDKFAAMKETFFREVKKVEQSAASGAGSEDVYESDYVHFENLNFLRICTVVDKTASFLDLENGDYFNNKENFEIEDHAKAMFTSTDSSPCPSPFSLSIYDQRASRLTQIGHHCFEA